MASVVLPLPAKVWQLLGAPLAHQQQQQHRHK
jgi:hypothetical protein